MAHLEHNDLSSPDETRTPDKTTVELVHLGGGQIGRYMVAVEFQGAANHAKPS